MTTCPFLELPNELLELIADRLKAPDIASLRLTCKKIHQVTYECFKKAYFEVRTWYLYAPLSMNELHRLSGDPEWQSVFKEIRFCTTNELTQLNESDHTVSTVQLPANVLSQNMDTDQLCAILRNLAACGNSPALVLDPQEIELEGEDHTLRPFKNKAMERLCDEPFEDAFWRMDPDAAEKLLHTVLDAEYPAHYLQLGCFQNPLPQSFLTSFEKSFAVSSSLAHLRQLFVSTRQASITRNTKLWKNVLNGFVRSLKRLSQLEYLSFEASAFSGKTYSLVTAMLETSRDSAFLPNLWGLELARHFVNVSELLQFVSNRRDKLRTLRLVEMNNDQDVKLEEIETDILNASGSADFCYATVNQRNTGPDMPIYVRSDYHHPPGELEAHLRRMKREGIFQYVN